MGDVREGAPVPFFVRPSRSYVYTRSHVTAMRPVLIVLSLLVGAVVGVAALMLLVRAPSFLFFALGLAALEWAPWALLVGAVGMGLAWLGRGARAAPWRRAATAGLVLNGGALAVIGAVWALALTTPPEVMTNVPGFEAVPPGAFSLGAFLSGPDVSATDVERVRDVTYASVGGEPLRMDVYRAGRPKPGMRPPALVVVHGGSWRGGDKGAMAAASRAWAAQGFVVFDVAYRLAPAHPFPAAVQDVRCAVGFVKANAARFGIDPERVVLVGRSAGAQVALVAAYAPPTSELGPSCPVDSTDVRAVVAYYAPTRMSYHDIIQPELAPGALDDYLGGAPTDVPGAYRLARPFTWIGPETPPTLLLHGERDQFVRLRDAVELGEALAEAGRPYAVVLLPWANHGFDVNFNGTHSQRVRPYVDRFLEAMTR